VVPFGERGCEKKHEQSCIMTIGPKKLEAPNVRVALQRAGMFLTGWEILASEIVDGVRQFFEIKPGVVGPEYDRDVVTRHKSPLEASVRWLVEQGALTVEQAERVDAMRRHRNEIAHELSKLLVHPNDEFDAQEVRDEDIYSGPSLLMAHLIAACESVASG